jgi:hypothetical protein
MEGAWRPRRPDPSHLHGSKVRFARDSPLEGGGFEPPGAVAHRMQELALGGLRPEPRRQLLGIAQQFKQTGESRRGGANGGAHSPKAQVRR